MSIFLDHGAFYDQAIRLSQKDKKDPREALASFFSCYRLHEIRHSFAEILETCLTTDTSPFDDPEERANLLTLLEKLEEVLEAAFIIAKREIKKYK